MQEGWQHLILRQLRQLDRRTLIQPDTGVMENFASVAIKIYYCSRHLFYRVPQRQGCAFEGLVGIEVNISPKSSWLLKEIRKICVQNLHAI